MARTTGGLASIADTTVLAGANYFYEVVAEASGRDSIPSAAVAVYTPPAVAASSVSDSEIDLAWSLAQTPATLAGNSTSGFEIDRFDGTGFSTLATLDASATTFNDTGLTPGTHYSYRVLATNSGATVAGVADAWTRPSAPSDLTGQVVSADEIDLSWVNQSPGATLTVGRSVTASDDPFAVIANLPADSTLYHDVSISDGISYDYVVWANFAGGQSGPSNRATLASPLHAPSNLAVANVTGDGIDITWTNSTANATAIEIDRAGGDGVFVPLTTTLGTEQTGYHDAGLDSSEVYSYRVRDVNAVSASSFVTTAPTLTLAAVSDVAATSASAHEIDLAWTLNVSDATGISVLRSTDQATYSEIASNLPGDSSSYSDIDPLLAPGTHYWYQIRVSQAAQTTASAPGNAWTMIASDLAAATPTSSEVDLAWDNSSVEGPVDIQRSTNGGSFSTLLTVDSSSSSYADLSVSSGQHVSYRLAATAADGTWVYSNTVDLDMPAGTATIQGSGVANPQTPYSLTLDPQGVSGIVGWNINWGDGSEIQHVDAANAAPFVTPHAFSSLGDFLVTANAVTATRTYAADALPIVVMNAPPSVASNNIAVNFQPNLTDIPNGDLLDIGYTFSDRSDFYSYSTGYVYGWDASMIAYSVKRNVATVDERAKTFISMQVGGVNHNWSIVLPNGSYRVQIEAGDPSSINSRYNILANGNPIVNYVPTMANPNVLGSGTVSVVDGRLTVSNGPGAVNNKIDWIDISPIQDAGSVPTVPADLTAVAESETSVALNWIDTADNATGYEIDRSSDGGATWSPAGTTGPNTASFADSGLSSGSTYQYKVFALNGDLSSSALVSDGIQTLSSPAEAPFGGTPAILPGTIKAENFDTGGEGIAYHETTPNNIGGQYRDTGVDIGGVGNIESANPNNPELGGRPNYMVGWTDTGEWLNYTVNVTASGSYRLDFRVASSGPGGKFVLSNDGTEIGQELNIPDTGGWSHYVTISEEAIALTQGLHVLQIKMLSVGDNTGGVANCDWFRAVAEPGIPAAPEFLTASPVPTGLLLNWQPPQGANSVSGWIVQRSDDGGNIYNDVGGSATTPLSPATVSWIDTSAPSDQTCSYVVVSVNSAGDASAPSNVASAFSSPQGATVLNSTAEAYASQNHANSASGLASVLSGRSLAGANQNIYLTFDLSAYTGDIADVKLRLYGRLDGSGQPDVPVDVRGVSNTSWTDGGAGALTWNNQPSVGPILSTETISEGMQRWYEWDITSYVKARIAAGATEISLMLTPNIQTRVPVFFNSDQKTVDVPSAQPVTAPTLVITPPPATAIIAVTATPIAATEGEAFSGIVASFTTTRGGTNASDYSAWVTWGDGSRSTGIVAADSTGLRRFTVRAANTFSEEGNSSFSITLTFGTVVGTASGLATIADASLTGQALTINGVAGPSPLEVMGEFFDADPRGTVADYSGTINWGNNITSTAVIDPVGSGTGFIVSGSYPYTNAGTYYPQIVISDHGASVTIHSTVVVSATGGSISGTVYKKTTQDDTATGTGDPPFSVHLTSVGLQQGYTLDYGIDYYEPTNSVIVPVSKNVNGNPTPDGVYTLGADGALGTKVGDFIGYNEVKLAAVRSGDVAGFQTGEMFYGDGLSDGKITRVYANGYADPNWVVLPVAEPLRGGLYIDRTDAFGGNLVVMTAGGSLFLVDPHGDYALLAKIPITQGNSSGTDIFESLVSVPNDKTRWGDLAGTILVADEGDRLSGDVWDVSIPQVDLNQNRGFFYNTPQAKLTRYVLPFTDLNGNQKRMGGVENFTVIPSNCNFYGISIDNTKVWYAPSDDFKGMVGDILITQEFHTLSDDGSMVVSTGLARLYWSNGSLQVEMIGETLTDTVRARRRCNHRHDGR